ncbi:MAG: hypothetical protein NTU53_14935 [Planctomycetota bacterium]|nr:hypothetical protein [Planctomycetota bacterium]
MNSLISFFFFVLLLLGCSCAVAQSPAPAPLSASSPLDQILDALDARGRNLNDFFADVSLSQSDTLGSGVSTLSGKVFYQSKPDADARMRVAFDTRKVGAKIDKDSRLEYLLDKGWLVEQDYKHKVQVDRQVLKPGQKINLLKLGEGPFPLPIGQSRADVLKMFDVKKIELAKDDPADTVHVQLNPKPGTQFERKFKSIDVWVDLKTNFPCRIETLDRNQTEVRTTDLSNIQVNHGLEARQFALDKTPDTWTHRTEEMSE